MTEHCATCGKESDSLKTCSGCNDTKYCNADCQKAHRKQHKADCKKKAAEFEVALFEIGKRAAELFDEILFKKPPPSEDCPICMLQLPSTEYIAYQMCCGKVICCGCLDAMGASDDCPFCRKPAASTSIEGIGRLNIRMELGDSNAFTQMGGLCLNGNMGGLKKDEKKAVDMFLRAADLGSADAHNNIANAYYEGTGGVEKDPNREMHHYQQAAIGGSAMARHNLGCTEAKDGNMDRAMKHWMISVSSGIEMSLDGIRTLFMKGLASKCEYETALREYQAYVEEVKSIEREKAKRKGMVGGSLYTQMEDFNTNGRKGSKSK